MKKPLSLPFVLLVLISLLFLSNCKYDDLTILPSSNIILYDKPLEVIKVNIQGQWKLVMVKGGLCALCSSPVVNHPYMNIAGDQILFGNDFGVSLDTKIVWKRDQNVVYGDYTYLLTYTDSRNNSFPYEGVVDRIKNDTLIIIDNAYDGYSGYYIHKN